jgi:hypothetical protein
LSGASDPARAVHGYLLGGLISVVQSNKYRAQSLLVADLKIRNRLMRDHLCTKKAIEYFLRRPLGTST